MKHLKITLQPGQQLPVALSGFDFVYCKQAAEEFELIVEGDTLTMGVGDKSRFERRLTQDDQAVLHNPNAFPLALVLIVGRGDYERQVIEGELNVVPSIIQADGTKLPDTRYWLPLSVQVKQTTQQQQITIGDLEARINTGYRLNHSKQANYKYAGTLSADGESFWAFGGSSVNSLYSTMHRVALDGEFLEAKSFKMPDALSGDSADGKFLSDVAALPDGKSFFCITKFGNLCLFNYETGDSVYLATLQRGSLSVSYTPNISIAINESTSELAVCYIDSDWEGVTLNVYDADLVAGTVGAIKDTVNYRSPGGNQVFSLKPLWLPELGWLGQYREGDGGRFFDLNGLQAGDVQTLTATIRAERVQANVWGGYGDFHYRDGKIIGIEYKNLNGGINSEIEFYTSTRWPETALITMQGAVNSQDQTSWRLTFGSGWNTTTADLTLTYDSAGRYLAEGQLIKAVLEMYLGRKVREDYMDYVFGVKVHNSGTATKVTELYSGNYTFSRAGYQDYGTMVMSGRIDLFVMKEILEDV